MAADLVLGFLIVVLIVAVVYLARFVSGGFAGEVLEVAAVPLIYALYHRNMKGK